MNSTPSRRTGSTIASALSAINAGPVIDLHQRAAGHVEAAFGKDHACRPSSLIDLISDLVAIGRDGSTGKTSTAARNGRTHQRRILRRIDREDRPSRQEGGDQRRVEKGYMVGDDNDPIAGGREIFHSRHLDPIGEAEQRAGQHAQHILRQQLADPYRDQRVGDSKDQKQSSGYRGRPRSARAVTAAAPAMNSALTTLLAAMIRALDASSLRLWIIA